MEKSLVYVIKNFITRFGENNRLIHEFEAAVSWEDKIEVLEKMYSCLEKVSN